MKLSRFVIEAFPYDLGCYNKFFFVLSVVGGIKLLSGKLIQ